MQIEHEIISFYAPTGSLLVRYFCAEEPQGLSYNIDVPLVDGAFVDQTEINALIEAMKPTGQLERLVALKTAIIPDTLSALIPAPVAVVVVDPTPPIIEGADAPPTM